MHIHRLQDLSIYYYVKGYFPNVKIVDSFPREILDVPTISVNAGVMKVRPFELGDNITLSLWNIDIFAKNKTQRDEFMYHLVDQLENVPIPINNYDEGFPPNITPSVIGHIRAENIEMTPFEVDLGENEKTYWRSTIRFITRYKER